jgi:hypothetical protein
MYGSPGLGNILGRMEPVEVQIYTRYTRYDSYIYISIAGFPGMSSYLTWTGVTTVGSFKTRDRRPLSTEHGVFSWEVRPVFLRRLSPCCRCCCLEVQHPMFEQ